MAERFDITVYQLGWRLGGKGATGRNLAHGSRIEEHGYHTLFGFYENVFAVMRDCYAQWNRDPSLPFSQFIAETKLEEETHPHRFGLRRENYFIMQQELKDGSWHDFIIDFPENTDVPGNGGVLPSPLAYIEEALQLLLRILSGHLVALETPTEHASAPHWWDKLEAFAGHLAADLDPLSHGAHSPSGLLKLALAALSEVRKSLGEDAPLSFAEHLGLDLLVDLLRAYLVVLWEIVKDRLDTHWISYLVWTSSDFICTSLIGMIKDDVLLNGFNSIDGTNFWEWLKKWETVKEGTLITNSSMWVQAAYDSSFAYANGDSTSPSTPAKPPKGTPNMGAGTMLRGGMRLMLTYKGAMAWKFQAGCADVMVSPLYEVLKARGVRFEFFSKVESLGVKKGDDGTLTIDSVRIQRQVELVDPAAGYSPLVTVKDIPCWPSEPDWSQIKDGDSLKKYNLESFWTPYEGVAVDTLKRGEPGGFDHVLLGIAHGALKYLTPELMSASPSWANMVETVKSVRTQAIQTWMSEDLQSLGWTGPDAPVNIGVQPLDTWADMTQTLQYEDWTGTSTPKSVQYFCSAFRDDPDQPPPPKAGYADTQTKWVFDNGVQLFERDSAHFWPSASAGGRFDWQTMFVETDVEGTLRLAAQFIRANIDPSERYVLSVAGSVGTRLPADGTDFQNLTICGDWTLNGLNVGCMEATVVSGLQASRAIAGYPEHIIGEEDWS